MSFWSFGFDFLLRAPLPPFGLQITHVPSRGAGARLFIDVARELANAVLNRYDGHGSTIDENQFFIPQPERIIRDMLMSGVC